MVSNAVIFRVFEMPYLHRIRHFSNQIAHSSKVAVRLLGSKRTLSNRNDLQKGETKGSIGC